MVRPAVNAGRMMRFGMSVARGLVAGLLAASLAGCIGVPLQTAAKFAALDPLNDDLSGAVLIYDLPDAMQPIGDKNGLLLTVTTRSDGERRVDAALQRAELPDGLSDSLPPPKVAHTYFLFGLTAKDQALVREAQGWARNLKAQKGDVGGQATLALKPAFCTLRPLDLTAEQVSVYVALPGKTALAPLMQNIKLADALKGAGVDALPPC